MEDKIKKQSIDRLNISVSILEGLKQNNIIKIEDKCSFLHIYSSFSMNFLYSIEYFFRYIIFVRQNNTNAFEII